jgi:hypothetical protein
MTQLSGNLGGIERSISTLLGAGLTLVALRRGTGLQRLSAGATGVARAPQRGSAARVLLTECARELPERPARAGAR